MKQSPYSDSGRYYSLNRYLQETFHEKVYKLALDGGMTCPNRDGTLGTRGCIFCSAGGSGDFAQKRLACESVTEQIEAAKARIAAKTKAGRFIAYFQSYTNTYAPVSHLRRIFTEAISHPDVAVLSIATRPDCLGPEVVSLLEELNGIKPVWVELGLQTIHERTARFIRRGYDLSCYEDAVRRLRSAGIQVIVHVILGLLGESRADMLETVRYLAHREPKIQGIKLQLLHILEGTDLASLYREGRVEALDLEPYLELIGDCLEELPPDLVIHRLTGDGPKRILLAPLWSGNKKLVLNALQKSLEERDIVQGARYQIENFRQEEHT